MTTENYKDDLFIGQFGQEKAKKTNFFDKYYEQRFLPYVKIPAEHVVIIVIGILMVVLMAYAVGVEVGKKFSEGKIILKSAPGKTWEQGKITEATILEQQILEETSQKEEARSAGTSVSEESKGESVLADYASTPYVVQLVTFSGEKAAREEVNRLKGKGFKANMTKSGKWYQVYAEGYRTIEAAEMARGILNKNYKDCYIRKVR